jgi:hypothetical protein
MDLTLPDSDAVSIEQQADKTSVVCDLPHLRQEDRAYHNLLASSVECFNQRIQES